MKTIKQLSANVLNVVAEEFNYGEGDNPQYDFKALEFENGLILVQSDVTNDWFFSNRNDIDACGNAQVIAVVDTGEVEVWNSDDLLKSIQGSISEFGEDSVPSNHFELWK